MTSLWQRWHIWILRRTCQISIVALFMLGSSAGILRGSLASSVMFEHIPLSDPFVLLQLFFAGVWPAVDVLIGAFLVVVFYALLGGRMFCSWVCPVNMVTDFAAWLRQRLNLSRTWRLSRQIRFWLLGCSLLLALFYGALVWELVNPVGQTMRWLVFGTASGWWILCMVFVFDLLVAYRGWCGHLCPQGAFYLLLGKGARVRVHVTPDACDHCMECYSSCPEPQVLKPSLKSNKNGWVQDGACTVCGRCVEHCPQQVFQIGIQGVTKRGEP